MPKFSQTPRLFVLILPASGRSHRRLLDPLLLHHMRLPFTPPNVRPRLPPTVRTAAAPLQHSLTRRRRWTRMPDPVPVAETRPSSSRASSPSGARRSLPRWRRETWMPNPAPHADTRPFSRTSNHHNVVCLMQFGSLKISWLNDWLCA